MRSRQRWLALAALLMMGGLALGGCGYQPLYSSTAVGASPTAAGPGSPLMDAPSTLAQIEVAGIPDRNGQVLRRLIIDQMQPRGPREPTLYRLQVSLSEQIRSLGVDKDDSTRRAQLIQRANIVLVPIGLGQDQPTVPLLQSQLRVINSFNLLDNPFANRVNRANASERGLTELSRRIVDRVALSLAAVTADAAASP